ncbi:glycosyl hydrolase 53 family protein [Paenibacillus aurantiacus]|uniref:Arabinogalactan endo-beta-1,4-galactanase n=1 Tax=Paenibacillus aurantiacus TaxID=1936118 RepID=A0ABV5KS46_9BACL
MYSAVPKAHAAPSFAYGADVSWLPGMEANGYKFYYRNGTQGDLLKILKTDFGINAVRIRTWVNPSTDPYSGMLDQATTIALAKRVQNEGMSVMIDFHYGDTWNSVGRQVCPVAWQNLSYTDLKTTLYNYTYNYLTALKNQGVTPAWVQVGNETNAGLCGYTGSLAYNPAQMAGLFNAGYDAVKAASPSTLAIIHLAGPQRPEIETFLNAFFANGGKTDMIGFSSYAGLANLTTVADRVEYIKNQYNKPVLMVEVGGAWNKAAENKTLITNWINRIKNIGGTGTGVFYWEPESPPGYNGGYTMGAVDTNMKWTVAMDAFREASGAGTDIRRIESYNFQGRYFRHLNTKARIDEGVTPLDDSRFHIVPGLAGNGTISFESVNNPGYYLRHSSFNLVLEKSNGTTTFNNDASFTRVAGLANSSWVSYRSYNFPDRYIRHFAFELKIEPISGSAAQADATFREVQ